MLESGGRRCWRVADGDVGEWRTEMLKGDFVTYLLGNRYDNYCIRTVH